MLAMGTTVSAEPAPKPAAVIPAASPRRLGNHLSALPTQVPYTAPAPTPPMAAAKYSIGSDDATEFSAHAIAQSRPPPTTTGRGPYLSTR
ncbi:hypothetical protein D3C85_1663990 [compost metagenome]